MFEENYNWRLSLTVPPESSPSGGAFFFQPSTEIKPTWCCLVVFQTSHEGNQPENIVLFSDISLERSVRLLGGMREGKGKGKGGTKPTCVHPSFFDLFIEKKTTATNQPTTNTQPTSPTNIQHGGPPSAGPTNISLSCFSLHTLLILFSLFESLFFPSWGPWMRPLLTRQKASKKKTGELQMCIFGSPTKKN